MSQEINLTEITHELPGKGMGMYLFRTGRRWWILSILPAKSWPLEQSNGISYLDHDETVTFHRTVSALLTFIVILPTSQKWHQPSHSSPASVLVLGAHSCITG
jgi:hypothetical protein